MQEEREQVIVRRIDENKMETLERGQCRGQGERQPCGAVTGGFHGHEQLQKGQGWEEGITGEHTKHVPKGPAPDSSFVAPTSGTAPHVPFEGPQRRRWMFLVAGQECSALFRIEQLTPGDSPAGTHDRCAHTGWGWCPACA